MWSNLPRKSTKIKTVTHIILIILHYYSITNLLIKLYLPLCRGVSWTDQSLATVSCSPSVKPTETISYTSIIHNYLKLHFEYCGIIIFHGGLIFAYFALGKVREIKP
jgi:hypothetical protein